MKRINKTIEIECGIYNTHYRLVEHRDGTITVIVPYIKWKNNSGSLDFEKNKIKHPSIVSEIKKFFEKNELTNDQEETIRDYIYYSHSA